MITKDQLIDPKCGRRPEEIPAYRLFARQYEDDDPTDDEIRQYVLDEEGTLNMENGHFLCDDCYIEAGMPSSPTGWKCP